MSIKTSKKIGECFQEYRLKRGYSVSDIEQLTKIPVKYVKAIEDARFGYLPGRTYTIGFIGSYAEVLGLDKEPLIEAYKEQYPDTEAVIEDLSKPVKGFYSSRLRGLIPLLLILLVFSLAALYYYRSGNLFRQADATTTETAVISVSTVSAQTTGSVTEPESTVGISTAQTAPTDIVSIPPETTAVSSIQGLRLVIRAAEGDCWIGYNVDDEEAAFPAHDRMLARDTSFTIEADSKISIRFGSAGAVQCVLNDSPVGSIGSIGQVVTREFTSP